MWHHKTCNIRFPLRMDNYGINYIRKAATEQLKTTLSSLYKITSDWSGRIYLGLTLKWDYQARTCNMSMPGYIKTFLQNLNHATATQS